MKLVFVFAHGVAANFFDIEKIDNVGTAALRLTFEDGTVLTLENVVEVFSGSEK